MRPEDIKILLIEDNPDDVELTLMAFKKHNLANHITVARDGEEALDIIFQSGKESAGGLRPDLILLDLKLPKVDGMEVLKQIKENSETKVIPVIILTSSKEENDLASAIAKEMAFPKDKIMGIRTAGVLHDIGKVAIPVEILSKPGRLSKTEFELIKNHSQVGYDILNPIKFPWPVSQIVLQHHERINGSGYPNGLSGKEILIEAKILGVADVVEAMASHRPYRPALGIDKALEEISINKGKLYDIEAANVCLKIFKDKKFEFK